MKTRPGTNVSSSVISMSNSSPRSTAKTPLKQEFGFYAEMAKSQQTGGSTNRPAVGLELVAELERDAVEAVIVFAAEPRMRGMFGR